MTGLLRANLFLLLLIAVFDPVDQSHLKAPLFASVWLIFLVGLVISSEGLAEIPPALYMYALAFIVVLPLAGAMVYLLRGGGTAGYEGLKYWKSYLFLTLCIPLAVKRINLIRPLTIVLSLLSLATIVLYVLASVSEVLRAELEAFGAATYTFSLTDRTYGNLTYHGLYFFGSSLLVVAVVYFSYHFMFSAGRAKLLNGFLLALNVCGMVMSGSRNNIVVGLMAPLLVFAWYRGNKTRITMATVLVAILLAGFASGIFQAMLSSADESNATKLDHLHDYVTLFADWRTLWFGQGFGASFFSRAWGAQVSLTELTYLEILRNYGLLLSPLLFFLILYPLKALTDSEFRTDHYLFLGYLGYLYLCTGDPLLLSSSGMLILAIVLVKVFCNSTQLSRASELATQPA
jgi:hypothetical protein